MLRSVWYGLPSISNGNQVNALPVQVTKHSNSLLPIEHVPHIHCWHKREVLEVCVRRLQLHRRRLGKASSESASSSKGASVKRAAPQAGYQEGRGPQRRSVEEGDEEVVTISKGAILYDLHEAREQLARGNATDARERIAELLRRLDFMLTPFGKQPHARTKICYADEFGRDNVHAVRKLCERAGRTIAQRDGDHAQCILEDAEDLWTAVPMKGDELRKMC